MKATWLSAHEVGSCSKYTNVKKRSADSEGLDTLIVSDVIKALKMK